MTAVIVTRPVHRLGNQGQREEATLFKVITRVGGKVGGEPSSAFSRARGFVVVAVFSYSRAT